MKLIKFILVLNFLLLMAVTTGWGTEFHARQPVLITSAGQSQDVTMVKILAQKAGIKFRFDKLARVDKLKQQATLILVAGGSTKGLGAANIDKEQELARVKALIGAARKAGMKIITIHIGGTSRRGKLSDGFNKLTARSSDCLIILKAGDKDKLFSTIASQQKIPIFLIDKIMEVGNLLKQIFAEQK